MAHITDITDLVDAVIKYENIFDNITTHYISKLDKKKMTIWHFWLIDFCLWTTIQEFQTCIYIYEYEKKNTTLKTINPTVTISTNKDFEARRGRKSEACLDEILQRLQCVNVWRRKRARCEGQLARCSPGLQVSLVQTEEVCWVCCQGAQEQLLVWGQEVG